MLLPAGPRTRGQLQSIAWNITRNSGMMLKAYALGLTANDLAAMSNGLINYVLTFLNDWCDGNRRNGQTLSIGKVVDIEDTVWSPTFGLKGKLDATVVADSPISGEGNLVRVIISIPRFACKIKKII